MSARAPAPARVAQLLAYSPDGVVHWRVSPGRAVQAGDVAGTFSPKAHLIVIDGYRATRARVVWCIAHGQWPSKNLVHMNGNFHDDRIENLRLGGTPMGGQKKSYVVSHCETRPTSLFPANRISQCEMPGMEC